MCAGAGMSDTTALKPTWFNLLKIMVWSCFVHLKEWPCFCGECVWCYELKKGLSQTMPMQRRSSTTPVLTLLFHTSWPAWAALGFSRKGQEPSSEWLMPHLLTSKDSLFTQIYRKLLSTCHTLEAFSRKTTQCWRKAAAETLPKENIHLEYLPSEFVSAQAL